MKKVNKFLWLLVVFALCRCNSSSTASGTSTMSATVAGTVVNFTTTVSSSNGYTIIEGTSSRYTLYIYLKTISASIFTLADPSTGYYATVSDGLGDAYSTDVANTGQITLTQSGVRFNGTFYFNADETSPSPGGGNIAVISGSCGNI